MNAESDHLKIRLFFMVLALAALTINAFFWKLGGGPAYSQPRFVPPSQASGSRQQPEPATRTTRPSLTPAAEVAAAARHAEQVAADEQARFFARYLHPGQPRKSGAPTVAIVVASEQGKLERTINGALTRRFQTSQVSWAGSFFKPEFVSDGLLDQMFSDPGPLITKLELGGALDALLLARQDVAYSTNPELEHVITARMSLEVMLIVVNSTTDSQTWKFAASGAGFKPEAARLMAEERLLKQLAAATNLTLNLP
jgi:hypothetical protein